MKNSLKDYGCLKYSWKPKTTLVNMTKVHTKFGWKYLYEVFHWEAYTGTFNPYKGPLSLHGDDAWPTVGRESVEMARWDNHKDSKIWAGGKYY